MSDTRNMELNDELMTKATGGAAEGGNRFKYAVGDSVTMIGKEGTVTRTFEDAGLNWYDVHFIANAYGPEEDLTVPEEELD